MLKSPLRKIQEVGKQEDQFRIPGRSVQKGEYRQVYKRVPTSGRGLKDASSYVQVETPPDPL